MPPAGAHQCHINVTYQCPSELPFSVIYQCQSVPPISAAYQCPCAAHQCRLTM
ncbi:unnamed protein product, partial [Staurois parvus]